MPVTIVDRLPLPNLKVYTAGSVLLLSIAVFHALTVTRDPNWRAHTALHRPKAMSGDSDGDVIKVMQLLNVPTLNATSNGTKNLTEQVTEVMTFMLQEPLCMWTLINIAYCALGVFGVAVQRLVFGPLRVAEAARVKDKLWNFLFYKFIFVFGVVNVQYMDEILLWCTWFTFIGFLHLLSQLCKDRFDYLSSWGQAGRGAHLRLVALLVGIQAACGALLAAAWRLRPAHSPADMLGFMAAEVILVWLGALHALARCALRAAGADPSGALAYYTHLCFDAGALVLELAHVAHMVVYSRLVVSLASLVLLLQLRHLTHRLRRRLTRHRRYAHLHHHMTRNYPMASKEEVEKNQDNCAICWEPMKEARKLPCAHLFHNSCLCQWVQQDASCPTCRRALAAPAPAAAAPAAPAPAALRLLDDAPAPANARVPNHLFHFDASRYVPWLPSFSVEVTRVRDPLPAAHIDALVQQVQGIFPQFGAGVLAGALAASRSVPATVDDILAGRLRPAPTHAAQHTAHAAHTQHTPHTQHTLHTEPSPPREPMAPPTDAQADDNDDCPLAAGGPWSAAAAEREAGLRARRARLLVEARRRYLRQHPPGRAPPAPAPPRTS